MDVLALQVSTEEEGKQLIHCSFDWCSTVMLPSGVGSNGLVKTKYSADRHGAATNHTEQADNTQGKRCLRPQLVVTTDNEGYMVPHTASKH